MDLKSLEIFKSVVEEGSISAAAEKLGRVQSNVSTRLKQLELDLGTPLFDRVGRGLVLTPGGNRLLGYAVQILDLAADARLALSDNWPGGPLRLGAMESTAAARLPAVTSRLTCQYPDIELTLQTGTAGTLYTLLKDRQLDAILIAEPVADETLEAIPVYQEQLVLITPESYPDFTDCADLSGKTLIGFEQGCAYRGYLERWLTAKGISPAVSLSMNSYLAIFSSVSAGMGFAVAPQSVLDLYTGGQRFKTYPLGGAMKTIRTLLVWRKNTLIPNVEALKELLLH